jgi:outer membrane immunogenic protein
MKKIVLAALIVVAGAVSASAADLPARTYTKAPVAPLPPPCIWCGFYVGLNGGWVGTSGSNDLSATTFDSGVPFLGPFVAPGQNNSSGGFGGGQIGYNWVFPGGMNGAGSGWLVGVEADIQGASLNGGSRSLTFAGDDGNFNTASASSRLNWFGTLRGRLGITSGPVLVYGTAGFAFGGVKNNLLVGFADDSDCSTCTATTLVSGSSTRTGWVAGAGIEWMFAPNWSVKGEYQYINLGSVTQTGNAFTSDNSDLPFEGTSATRNVNLTFNTVRVGVNYHFGGPVVAKY